MARKRPVPTIFDAKNTFFESFISAVSSASIYCKELDTFQKVDRT